MPPSIGREQKNEGINTLTSPVFGVLQELVAGSPYQGLVAYFVALALPDSQAVVLVVDEEVYAELPLAARSIPFDGLYIEFRLEQFPTQILELVVADVVKRGDKPRAGRRKTH